MRDESRKLFSYFLLAPESAEMLRPTKLRQHDQRLKQITVYLRGGWVSRILFSDQTSEISNRCPQNPSDCDIAIAKGCSNCLDSLIVRPFEHDQQEPSKTNLAGSNR